MVGPETPSEPHVIEKGLSFDVNPSNGMLGYSPPCYFHTSTLRY